MSRALGLLLLAIALLWGGYHWGATATTNAYEAGQLKEERANTTRLQAEVQRGQVASGGLQMDLRDLADDYRNLDGAFNAYRKTHSILVRHSAPAGTATVAASGSPAADSAATPGCIVLPVAPDAEPELSRGAVWMWNSALAGTDAPAGACGLADQSPEACATGTGLSLDDAWANQAVNAQLCAEDRARHQHLIDFIKGHKP